MAQSEVLISEPSLPRSKGTHPPEPSAATPAHFFPHTTGTRPEHAPPSSPDLPPSRRPAPSPLLLPWPTPAPATPTHLAGRRCPSALPCSGATQLPVSPASQRPPRHQLGATDWHHPDLIPCLRRFDGDGARRLRGRVLCYSSTRIVTRRPRGLRALPQRPAAVEASCCRTAVSHRPRVW